MAHLVSVDREPSIGEGIIESHGEEEPSFRTGFNQHVEVPQVCLSVYSIVL